MKNANIKWVGEAGDTNRVSIVGDALNRTLDLGDEREISSLYGAEIWQELDKEHLAAGLIQESCGSGYVEDGEVIANIDLIVPCDFEDGEPVDWKVLASREASEDELARVF